MALSGIEFATKCVLPKRSPQTLSRRRLLDLLHGQVAMRTQVLVAPAGYGKTTLLGDFASELDVPVCWYTVDSSDQDIRTLIDGIMASVRTRFPDFGKITAARLDNCKDLTAEIPQVIGTLTGELSSAIPDYCVLVLDDCQAIESGELSRMVVNQLLERAPDNCHVIISSRIPLDLPALARLRLKQAAAEVQMSQLAFNAAEVKTLLAEQRGLHLTDEEAEQLVVKNQGWILGILLSAYSLKAGKPQKRTFAFLHHDVDRYLTAEVYDRQAPELRSFLLSSATLEQIEPEICDRLLEKCSTLKFIRALEKESLFLQCIDQDRALYRYHQIFREFLQRKLLEEDTEQYLSLHTRAAKIYREFGRHQEAVAHFLKARDYGEAAEEIKSASPEYLKSGKWTTVSRWIEALPERERAGDEISLLYAQSLVYLGRANESIKILNEITGRVNEERNHLVKARALNWRSAAYSLAGYACRAQDDIENAVALLEKYPSPPSLLGDAYKRLGKRKREQGKLQTAERYLKKALGYFLEVYDLADISDINNALGVIYGQLCQGEKAALYFEKARQGWAKVQNYGGVASTLINLAHIYQRKGQFELSLDTLASAFTQATVSGYSRVQASVMINRGEVLRDLNKYKDALNSYQKGLDLAREVIEPYFVAWAKAGLGETHRLLGNREKAELYIREAIAEAREQNFTYEVSLFTVQLGIIAYENAEYETGIRTLEKSCGQLSGMSDSDAQAKAQFHLAQAFFLSGNKERALEYLKKCDMLANYLGYDEFIAVEGRRATALMEFAIAQDVNPPRFAATLEKIRARRSAQNDFAEAEPTPVGTRRGIKAYAFGESRVTTGASVVDDSLWRSNRAKEIFFYLLCSETARTREDVTTAIWPDLSPERATSNFHINLYRIRRAIDPGIITLEQGRYKINPSFDVWCDATALEQSAKRTQGKFSAAGAAAGLEKAADLYCGPFLSEVYSEWAEEKRKSIHETYLKILRQLARLYTENGRHARAVEILEKYIKAEPYQDDAYCQLIEQHLLLRDEASASRVYHRYCETVTRETGSHLSPRMATLHKRLTK
jgi:LuxR family transcriptional regulator, maltose regulon positive regulatory protein